MRAVLCKEWGEPSSLVLEEVETPAPDAGEVRVSVRAAGVNFPDNPMISGSYQYKPPFPFNPGFEVSGTIPKSARASKICNPATGLWPRSRTAATLSRSSSPGRAPCRYWRG